MKSLSYGGLFTSKELFIPESPHLTGFSKAHKCSNKTVNRSNDPLTRRAHAELGKNYEILLLATLTSVLTRKLNARLGGRHFGSNSALYGAKRQSNARNMGMDGFGIDWYINDIECNHTSLFNTTT